MVEHVNLEKIKEIALNFRDMSYEELVFVLQDLSTEEIILLSREVGYPVFLRRCMGKLQHLIPILQDGAAVIIVDSNGRILLQSRSDRNKWGVPGGCQEVGESFEQVAIREVKEETNLDIQEEDLQFICAVSGESRKNSYPNKAIA